MRAVKVQVSLRIRADSPEPPLLAHTSSESRGTPTQKARSLAPLNGWTCAVTICHDGMLEDTNSLDGAHVISGYLHYDIRHETRISRRLLFRSFESDLLSLRNKPYGTASGPRSGLAGHHLLPHKPTLRLSYLNLFFCIIKYFTVPKICIWTPTPRGLQVTSKRMKLQSVNSIVSQSYFQRTISYVLYVNTCIFV